VPENRIQPDLSQMAVTRAQYDVPHKRQRTAIANGAAILAGVDGRSHVARRYREVGALLAGDLGGATHLTEAQKQLVRCASGLVVLREALDVKAAKGEKVDSGEYCSLSNTLRRVLVTIGLKREPHLVEDDLDRAWADAVREADEADEAAAP
jgi:hypothetical protein